MNQKNKKKGSNLKDLKKNDSKNIEKVKSTVKENLIKEIPLILIAAGILALVVALVFVFKKPKEKVLTEEETLVEKVKVAMDRLFVRTIINGIEDDYDRIEFFKNHNTEGKYVNYSAETLMKSGIFEEGEKEYLEKYFGENGICDAKNTKAIFIPGEQYSKTDYRIEIDLDCNFLE